MARLRLLVFEGMCCERWIVFSLDYFSACVNDECLDLPRNCAKLEESCLVEVENGMG